MKHSNIQIAIAVLLAALAGFLGATVADRWFAHDQKGGIHEFVHEQLDLNQEQKSLLARLEERHAIENAQLELKVRQANAGLAAAIDNEHEYGPEVSAAIDEVHASMGELQKATIRHVFAMRTILEPEQQREFDQQVSRSLTGSPPE